MGRRYLTPLEAQGALRGKRAIEQFLGCWVEDGSRLIKWLRIYWDPRDGYGVTNSVVYDEGREDFVDIIEFQSLDPDEPFGCTSFFEDWESAWNNALDDMGAFKDKFVQDGMIQEEYLDFINREGFWVNK